MAQFQPFDPHAFRIRGPVAGDYADLLTKEVLKALSVLTPLDEMRRDLMTDRLHRRAARAREGRRIDFLNARRTIPGLALTVQEARDGRFAGCDLPPDLRRQWIQGMGPATRPGRSVERSLRAVAYALLSGADGWIFDGEDALGQISTLSLDNQRNLRLAFSRDPVFLKAAEEVSRQMNKWSREFLGRPIVTDWRRQLEFTTRLFRPRGLHLDDRHIRTAGRAGLSASIVDLVLYVVHNHERLRASGSTIAFTLPKIQTAEEAALWNRMLVTLENHLSLPAGALKAYVMVEQLEAAFQLMEIRAALGIRFIGFILDRWDFVHSVTDAMAWDPKFNHPNLDSITMTYGYLRACEDRVRRAAATPDREGRRVPWQGGVEPHVPVGPEGGVHRGMRRAAAGAEREWREGASGKLVPHWKLVPSLRVAWERSGEENQVPREFPPLTYAPGDAEALIRRDPAPRTVRGARDLLSVGLQVAAAFGQGTPSAALKAADLFSHPGAPFLREDLATGEIRLSLLWEWVQKGAPMTEGDESSGVQEGDPFTPELFERLLNEEHSKLMTADERFVPAEAKSAALPVAREIVRNYVTCPFKPPWFADFLNLNLDNQDVEKARSRIDQYLDAFEERGVRLTENLDFETTRPVP